MSKVTPLQVTRNSNNDAVTNKDVSNNNKRRNNNNDIASMFLGWDLSDHDCERLIDEIRNRPTRTAAYEFLSDLDHTAAEDPIAKFIDWKSLPYRLQRLCNAIDNWENYYDHSMNEYDDNNIYRCTADDLLFYDSCCYDTKENALKAARISAMTASVVALAPPTFPKALESLLCASLEYRDSYYSTSQQQQRSNDTTEDDDDNDITEHEYLKSLFYNLDNNNDETRSESLWIDYERSLFNNIRRTRWVVNRTNGLLYDQLCDAIYKAVDKKIRATIDNDEGYSQDLYKEHIVRWKEQVVEPWLLDLLHGPIVAISNNKSQQQQQYTLRDVEPIWKEQIDALVGEIYASVRMEQIFSIVTDYPYSLGTVLELKDLLENTQQYQHTELAQQLRNSLIRKLNHPGATTSQIIDVYIDTIKVLRIIDPSDRLLSVVAEPVRTYLRGRNDTIRCIITSLTDGDGDLYQELRRQDAKPLENVTVDSDDEEEPPDLYNWQPLPSINKPKGTFLSPVNGKPNNDDCDILAMLVSIYGSKELFVDEYRLMLADKLLSNLDYNTDSEVHTLELLKLRFGETSMRNCEVMIKDMDDSKRTNTLIHSTIESKPRLHRNTDNTSEMERITTKPVVDAVMVSHIFWPTLQNKEQLKHHPRIQNELNEFTDIYAKLKNPRKLEWMNQLGTVQIELDVIEESKDDDGDSIIPRIETKEFTCSPLLATLIAHFEDKPSWTSEDLSNETGVPENIIQKRMAYWVSNRVLVSSVGTNNNNDSSSKGLVYQLASHAHRQQNNDGNDHIILAEDEIDDDNKAVSASTQEQEEMEIYESFITAMLTNTGQSSLDRIHNMLKMFVSAGSETKYNKTPQQLSAFLQYLCRQEKLECGPDGMYKLYKKE